MITHDLRELSSLPKPTVEKVASFKPYLDYRIQTYCYASNARVMRAIRIIYENRLQERKDEVCNLLRPFYNRSLMFSDKLTSDLLSKARTLAEISGKTMEEVVREFRIYFGHPVMFFRKDERGKTVPVECGRILEAYKAMKNKAIIKKIEKILYQ